MCELLWDEWQCNLEWDQLHSYTPNGHLVELRVGNNNGLRLPHILREGVKSKELPETETHHCYSVRNNTPDDASSEFFHRLFNHAHADKVRCTLGATTGYEQPDKPLPPCRCEACATTNSRK